MNNERLKSIFTKTMDVFEEYSYGFRDEKEEEKGIITIITPDHELELYESYEEKI